MKKLFTLLMLFFTGTIFLHAQAVTEPDQNPNYGQSMHKYMGSKDSLLAYANTTIDQSYKAYDFYEARLERKQLRRDRRYNIRMTRAENSYYPSYNYGNYGGYNSWNNWGNYGSMLIPNVGFRSGNWWFGW